MQQVCCLVPDGFTSDLLRQQYKSLTALEEQSIHLDFYPPENFPGGFFWYICPVSMILELVEVHGVLPGHIMAFGCASHLSLSLAAGICDYLKEPWDLDELLARISHRWKHPVFHFSWGELISDGCKTSVNGVLLEQTQGFHRVVHLLALNAGKDLSRKHLLTVLGIYDSNSRVVDVYASLLRRAIAGVTGQSKGIVLSNYGYGYQLAL